MRMAHRGTTTNPHDDRESNKENNMFEAKWIEINRQNHLVTKSKVFKTENALIKFLDKPEAKGNLYQILGFRA